MSVGNIICLKHYSLIESIDIFTVFSHFPDMVREACSSRMLQSWLRIYEGNILELLKALDVENSLDTSEQALKTVFKKIPVPELISNFDIINDEWVLYLNIDQFITLLKLILNICQCYPLLKLCGMLEEIIHICILYLVLSVFILICFFGQS